MWTRRARRLRRRRPRALGAGVVACGGDSFNLRAGSRFVPPRNGRGLSKRGPGGWAGPGWPFFPDLDEWHVSLLVVSAVSPCDSSVGPRRPSRGRRMGRGPALSSPRPHSEAREPRRTRRVWVAARRQGARLDPDSLGVCSVHVDVAAGRGACDSTLVSARPERSARWVGTGS